MAGRLDPELLRGAFEQVEDRHEALRVHFEAEDGLPVQVVGPGRPFALPVEDLRPLGPAAGREHVLRETAADAARRFRLDGDRLWRVRLYRTADDEHYLWLNLHHTITDGYSVGVLFRDLEAYYEAARAGTPARLPDLPVQYGDYAAWEQGWRRSPAYREQVAFWKETLAAPLPTLDLPFANPRPPEPSFRGERMRFEVRPELAARIDRLCREHAVSRFLVGLAAFQTVLHRYTGLDNLPLGAPVKNRAHAETRHLVGLFVNTVVLRTSLAGDPTFADQLGRARRTRDEALARAAVSLESLIEELRPARDPGRQPFFQAAFYYQNVPTVPARFAGTTSEAIFSILEAGGFRWDR
jgi:hypothetical protein